MEGDGGQGGTSSNPDGGAADAPSSTGDAGVRDASGSDAQGSGAGDGGIEQSLACFDEWKTLGHCPAPVVTAAYLTDDCEGTTSGVFVVGSGFESSNTYAEGVGVRPNGPSFVGGGATRTAWNVLTPTYACVTTSADPGTWANFPLTLTNPDGRTSNTVTVQNLLGSQPSLPSTGSDDPLDPDACLDAGMTASQAIATFAPGATSSTLGAVSIVSHTRTCNPATGCSAWSATTTVAFGVSAGLATTNQGQTVDFTLGGTDCGQLQLGGVIGTLTYDDCSLPSGSYQVHVAAHCLSASQTQYSSVASDGSYTQTDFGALLRY